MMDETLLYEVNSRRRGKSIGINPFPGKNICSFDCIYCFRGETTGSEAVDLVSSSDVRGALSGRNFSSVDSVDFSGTGEPTLHPRIGDLIGAARDIVGDQVDLGIFTNSSTLTDPGIRRSLNELDTVEAKLDTPFKQEFQVINKPFKTSYADIVNGLIDMGEEYAGKLNIQTTLLKHNQKTNTTKNHAKKMAKKLKKINPDEVHLYTIYREPPKKTIRKVTKPEMKRYANILKDKGLLVETYH